MNLAGLLEGKDRLRDRRRGGPRLCHREAFAAAGARGIAFDPTRPVRPLPKGWSFGAGDVRDEESLARCLSAGRKGFDRLDLLVANAGIAPPWRESESIDLDEWDEAFAVNARGVMATIKQAIPLMKAPAARLSSWPR